MNSTTRFSRRRAAAMLATAAAGLATTRATLARQTEATPEATPAAPPFADVAFSSEKIDGYGYPELPINFTGDGFDVPAELEAGYYVAVLTPPPGIALYFDLMQPPAGLAHDEAVATALVAAGQDVVEPDWVFGGGSYAFMETENRFIVHLEPGEWQIAASFQPDGGDEVLELYPLTVTEPGAGTAGAIAPDPDVVMELNDVAFGGLDASITAGPTLFEVRNIGEQPRQMVLFRTDQVLTSDDYAKWFGSMTEGADAPPPPPFATTWVGYAALTSPGYATWIELDLEPGIYTATSWIVDPESGMPALLLGMVQSFTVE